MKKWELKLWHPIAGIATMYLLEILNNNLIHSDAWFLFYDIIGWMSNVFIFMLLYVIIRNTYRLVKRLVIQNAPHKKQTAQQSCKMQDIEQEMNEIEASLDAVTNNEKITPIWELPHKEP